ncbi:MAG: hypothetical protein JNM66_14315 [Bryobacterales bacterium]|nr:hypothetical protein [Bryobacterales bacterium]
MAAEEDEMTDSDQGSAFDNWHSEEGIYEQATAQAIERVLARQLESVVQAQNLSRTEMGE